MVKVRLWGSLTAATDGRDEVEVTAATLRDVLDGLADQFPALRPQLDRGVSVSIDGRIYNDSWFTPVSETSEIVLLARLKGG